MNDMNAHASPLSLASLSQLTLSLVGIVALIFAITWVLKRMRLAAPRGRGQIAVLDELAIGPRERILLIRVGEAQVLVGIGGGTMVGLNPLAAPITLTSAAAAPLFGDRLREFMKRPSGSAPSGFPPSGGA